MYVIYDRISSYRIFIGTVSRQLDLIRSMTAITGINRPH